MNETYGNHFDWKRLKFLTIFTSVQYVLLLSPGVVRDVRPQRPAVLELKYQGNVGKNVVLGSM